MKTLAVLPFKSSTLEEADVFFACGLQEELALQLGRMPTLRLIGRESVLRYNADEPRDPRSIARELTATHLLEGAVQRRDGKLLIELSLLDGATGASVWSARFDWPESDLLRLQSDLGLSVARQLELRLTPEIQAAMADAPTKHREAYELYLRAEFTYRAGRVVERLGPNSRANHFETISLLERAVALDPAFHLAYCRLARTHHLMYSDHFDRTQARLDLGAAALAQAAKLRPDSAEVRLERARRLYRCLGEHRAAQAEIEKARQVQPNDPEVLLISGLVERKLGLWQQSEQSLRQAMALNPWAVQIPRQLALLAEQLRKYDLAAEMRDRVVKLHPENDFARVLRARVELYRKAETRPLLEVLRPLLAARAVSRDVAGQALLTGLWTGDAALAAQALERLPAEGFFTTNLMPFPRAWCEMLVAQQRGERTAVQRAATAARAAFERLLTERPTEPTLHSLLGLTLAALGAREEAIASGRRGVELQSLRIDHMDAADPSTLLVAIYAATGDRAQALAELRQVASRPNFLAHYGLLRLDPWWAPLRGHADFDALLDSLAWRQP